MNTIRLAALLSVLMASVGISRPLESMRPDHSPAPVPPDHPLAQVILVHGFLETGQAYRTMCRRLAEKQIASHVVKLTPSSAYDGIEPLARELKEQIDSTLGTHQRFSIVGFSMGGLVSRYYLQELGGAARCDQLITLSSPHHGTYAAWLYPGKGAIQMRPGSEFLNHLAQTEDRLAGIRLTSYRTPLDLVILPTRSSIWERADNLSYPILLHPWMIQSNRITQDIEQRLLAGNGPTKIRPSRTD